MAKWTKRNNPHTARTTIVRVPQARPVAPIIRVSAPRSSPKKKHHHRRSAVGSLSTNHMMNFALGGAALGFIEKSFGASLPVVPLIGRKGVIAIGAYYMGKGKGGLWRDVAIAGAVLAGYELGATGKISGEEMVGEVVPQISGVAAQV
jgi:hypothetical protein